MPGKLSEETFLKKLHAVHPKLTILEPYKNVRSPIKTRCEECGYEWSPTGQGLLKGHGCPVCGQRKAIQTKQSKPTARAIELEQELKEKFPTIHPRKPLRTATEEVEFECDVCHNVWVTAPNRLIHQKGCPRCSSVSTSLAEQFLYCALCTAYPDETVRNRDRQTIGKELDVLLPSQKVAVEFGSWFWHKNRVKNDIEKEKLCKKKGINLITIYDHIDETPTLLPKNAITVKKQINRLDSCTNLAKLVLQKMGYKSDLTTFDWNKIYEEALAYCGPEAARAHFNEVIKETRPDITVIGKYSRFNIPIEFQCNKCGYIWKTAPKNILYDHTGCPKCARIAQSERQLKSTEDFAKELKALNPNLHLISEYTHSRSNVKIRCNNCGCTWTARADYVLADHKCPSCETAAKRKGVLKPSAQGHIKKQENLNTKLAKLDKNIEIIGKVTSDDEPVACRCKKCKTVFERSPKDLRRHPHCPKCNGHFRYTPETFRERMEEINPDIEVIGDFKKQAEKLECRCKICDHHWMVTPNKLLQGRSCPACASKLRSAAGVAARKKKKEAESKDSA